MNLEISIKPGSGGSDVNDLSKIMLSMYSKSLSKANIKHKCCELTISIQKTNKEQKDQLLQHNYMMRIIRVSPYCKKFKHPSCLYLASKNTNTILI